MLSYKNEPLAKYASFRTGGNGDLVLFPQNQDELVSALREHKDAIVLGNASNTLITDKGIRGTVIFTTEIKEISINKNEITAASGASLSALAAFAAKNLLSGLEFLYGIPGTVGGAIYMNAGAYGGEIGNFIKEVRIFSPEYGIITLNRSEMNFGYRQSILQEKKYVAISAVLSAENRDFESIKSKMDEYMQKRKASQPLEYPSCGSTFKRPEGYFAGKLISDCGLKGFAVGGAEVSEKHAGFVINKNNATSKEALELIAKIKQKVFENTGVLLKEEIRIIGEI